LEDGVRKLTAADFERLRRGEGLSLDFSTEAQDREINQRIARLSRRLKTTIRNLVPKCTQCGSTDIRTKTSSHLVDPGNKIIGPAGRGPRYATHVDCLHCENCGTTYYKSGVAKIEQLMREIESAQNELFRLRHPHRC
jgi:hypothetical protein